MINSIGSAGFLLFLMLVAFPSFAINHEMPLGIFNTRFIVSAGVAALLWILTLPFRKLPKYWEHLGFESERGLKSVALFGVPAALFCGPPWAVCVGVVAAWAVTHHVVKHNRSYREAVGYNSLFFWSCVVATSILGGTILLSTMGDQQRYFGRFVVNLVPIAFVTGTTVLCLLQFRLFSNSRLERAAAEEDAREYFLRRQGVPGTRENLLEAWRLLGPGAEQHTLAVWVRKAYFNGAREEELAPTQLEMQNRKVDLMVGVKPSGLGSILLGLVVWILGGLTMFPLVWPLVTPLVVGLWFNVQKNAPLVPLPTRKDDGERVRGLELTK